MYPLFTVQMRNLSINLHVQLVSYQERLANIGPEEFVQTFIPRDEADLRVRSINLFLALLRGL